MRKFKAWFNDFYSNYIRAFIITVLLILTGILYLIYNVPSFQDSTALAARSQELKMTIGLAIVVAGVVYFPTRIFEAAIDHSKERKLETKLDEISEQLEQIKLLVAQNNLKFETVDDQEVPVNEALVLSDDVVSSEMEDIPETASVN